MIPIIGSKLVAEPQKEFCPKVDVGSTKEGVYVGNDLPHMLNGPATTSAGDPVLEPHEILMHIEEFAGDDEEEPSEIDHKTHPPLINLVLSFLALNPDPTDEEFHQLATAAKVPPEELEEAVYRLLATMVESDEDDLDLHKKVEAALNEVKGSLDRPEEGEFDGIPDLGLDPIAEDSAHDGDPRP